MERYCRNNEQALVASGIFNSLCSSTDRAAQYTVCDSSFKYCLPTFVKALHLLLLDILSQIM